MSGYFASFARRSGPLAASTRVTSVRPAERRPDVQAEVAAQDAESGAPPIVAQSRTAAPQELRHDEAASEPRPLFEPSPKRTKPVQFDIAPAEPEPVSAPAAAGAPMEEKTPPAAVAADPEGTTPLPSPVAAIRTVPQRDGLPAASDWYPATETPHVERVATTEPERHDRLEPLRRPPDQPKVIIAPVRPVLEQADVPERADIRDAKQSPVEVKIGSISIEVRAPKREPERSPVAQPPRVSRGEPTARNGGISLSRLYWRGW